jgi:hypothetical protein
MHFCAAGAAAAGAAAAAATYVGAPYPVVAAAEFEGGTSGVVRGAAPTQRRRAAG